MTTAHRATWKAMRAGLQEEGSFRLHVPSAATSSKDAPTEPTLKTRARPREESNDDAKNVTQQPDNRRAELRDNLELAERSASASRAAENPALLPPPPKRARSSRFASRPPEDDIHQELNYDPEQVAAADAAAGHITRRPTRASKSSHSKLPHNLDEDVDADSNALEHPKSSDVADDDSDSDSDSGSDSDSSDDEAELLAEVERLRQERAAEREEAALAAADRAEAIRDRDAAAANPLLGDLTQHQPQGQQGRRSGDQHYTGGRDSVPSTPSVAFHTPDDLSDTASLAGSEMTGSVATGASVAYAVRRRWDDDVVFHGQAGTDRAPRPRFLNDTTRNDFHRRFMKKYMR